MTMIECLRDFKVSVDCLLLPRQPGRAYSRLSSKESLVALFDVLLAGSGGDLSQYAQVRIPGNPVKTAHAASESRCLSVSNIGGLLRVSLAAKRAGRI